MIKSNITITVLLLALTLACNRTPKEVIKSTETEKNTPPELNTEIKKEPVVMTLEKFGDFNSRFHTDSVFQMSRVSFPIEGYFVDNDGNENRWDINNWILHRAKAGISDTSLFEVTLKESEDKVIEKIKIKDSGFYIERRFKRQSNGKWYLIYYIDEDF